MGLMTALGTSVSQCWQRLLGGESAIHLRQPFADLPVIPLAMVGKYPAGVDDLLLPALAEALEDAGLQLPLPDCGVVVGSSRSYQGTLEALAIPWLRQGTVPPGPQWLNALPHMAATMVVRKLGSTGPLLAPMAACATGLWAIVQGAELIRQGRCDRVIVGAVEAPITPLTLAGFLKMGVLAPTGCYPFSSQREGLVLGEGAAVLVLESAAALAQNPYAKVYGRILGAGLTADAYHMTAPDPQQCVSSIALQTCLRRSGLTPEAIDYVHTHGTSTDLNDRQELELLAKVFSRLPAASSTKGATGHTLGASGAVGAVFSLMALKHQIIPPNVGLKGEAIYPPLVRTATAQELDYILCFSFGFGGQNAVLGLGREGFEG